MQAEPIPLAIGIPAEVPLSKAPLVRVLTQIKFPPILSIRKEDRIADFQEALRADYPHLHREAAIWRLANRQAPATWRVSLGVDFVALETWSYNGRRNFLGRLRKVLASVEACFGPAEAQRVGLRYINRLEGAAVERLGDVVHESVLGILKPDKSPPDALRKAMTQSITQARFLAAEGVIQGRWGNLPPNSTYDPNTWPPAGTPSWVLDLDMFSPEASPFRSEELVVMTDAFAKRIYSVFRLMVTDEFLRLHGGTP